MITFSPMIIDKMDNRPKRHVTNAQKALLKEKLLTYRASIFPTSTDEFLPVGSTNVLFEFDHYQINQVLQNCVYIFTMENLLEHD